MHIMPGLLASDLVDCLYSAIQTGEQSYILRVMILLTNRVTASIAYICWKVCDMGIGTSGTSHSADMQKVVLAEKQSVCEKGSFIGILH